MRSMKLRILVAASAAAFVMAIPLSSSAAIVQGITCGEVNTIIPALVSPLLPPGTPGATLTRLDDATTVAAGVADCATGAGGVCGIAFATGIPNVVFDLITITIPNPTDYFVEAVLNTTLTTIIPDTALGDLTFVSGSTSSITAFGGADNNTTSIVTTGTDPMGTSLVLLNIDGTFAGSPLNFDLEIGQIQNDSGLSNCKSLDGVPTLSPIAMVGLALLLVATTGYMLTSRRGEAV